MRELSARLRSVRFALGRLAERKAFESYIRYGHMPDALLGVKAACAHEPTLSGTCANLSVKALGDLRPTTHYTWRTVGDGKVRHSHAGRDGRIFAWTEPPEGGHPGAAPNCRCQAEPYYGNPAIRDSALTLVPHRDVSNDSSEVWSEVEAWTRPDGSVIASRLVMRDGTQIRSTFAGQAEQHIVGLPGDAQYLFGRDGQTRQATAFQSGEVVGRVAWLGRTIAPPLTPLPLPEPYNASVAPPIFPGETHPLDKMVTPFAVFVRGALALYNALVSAPDAMGAGSADLPVLAIKAWQGVGQDGQVTVSTEVLTAEQVVEFCRLLPEVQDWTDSAASALAHLRPITPPNVWGTIVHAAVHRNIISLQEKFPTRYENVKSELSVLPSLDRNSESSIVKYGASGSSRLDVIEYVDQNVACTYDIKTGDRGLSLARVQQLAASTLKAGKVNVVIIVQVGITWPLSGR